MRKFASDKVATRSIVVRSIAAGIVVVIAGVLIYLAYGVVSDIVPPASKSDESGTQTEVAETASSLERRGTDTEGTSWMIGLLVILSTTTLVSVGISFYLYRWRRILLGRPNLLVPEEWGKHLDKVGRSVDHLENSMDQQMGLLRQDTDRTAERIENLGETFLALQIAIDYRDEENNRLKKGYDATIYRRFLNRFVRVDQLIEEFLSSEDSDSKSLRQVKHLIEDALDECGVEMFEPVVGEDSRTAFGIVDNPKTVRTDQEDQEFKIVEVLQPGYRLRGNDDYDVLIPAKVCIAVCDN